MTVAMEIKNEWLRVFIFLIFVISSGGGYGMVNLYRIIIKDRKVSRERGESSSFFPSD